MLKEEHLGPGSVLPPKTGDTLRLYSMEICPFAQRARLVLKAKNIPHEIVNIDLINKPDWYFKIHPEGKVPALDTGTKIVVESGVISEFLDETYPEVPLFPEDPEAKKRDQELIKKMDPLIGLFYQCVLGQVKKTPEEWAEAFGGHLEIFEEELKNRGNFFGGEKPGMVDYMLWPWGLRAKIVGFALGQRVPFADGQFNLLKKWLKDMKEDPACKASLFDPEIYWNFIQTSWNKK